MIRYVLQFKCNIFSLNQKKYVEFIVFYLRIGSLRKERIPRFPAPDRSAGKRGRRPHTYYLIVRNAPKQDAEALFGFESAAYIYKLFNNTLRRRRFREIRENSIFSARNVRHRLPVRKSPAADKRGGARPHRDREAKSPRPHRKVFRKGGGERGAGRNTKGPVRTAAPSTAGHPRPPADRPPRSHFFGH